jgi:hypothetical protein
MGHISSICGSRTKVKVLSEGFLLGFREGFDKGYRRGAVSYSVFDPDLV